MKTKTYLPLLLSVCTFFTNANAEDPFAYNDSFFNTPGNQYNCTYPSYNCYNNVYYGCNYNCYNDFYACNDYGYNNNTYGCNYYNCSSYNCNSRGLKMRPARHIADICNSFSCISNIEDLTYVLHALKDRAQQLQNNNAHYNCTPSQIFETDESDFFKSLFEEIDSFFKN